MCRTTVMDMETAGAELPDEVRRITRAEFNAMGDAGLFEDEQVELLEGVIVSMAAEGGPHVKAVMWLTNHFARMLSDDVMVGVSHPYAASDYSQPQPDLAVVDVDDVRRITDGVRGARLLVEVAVSSRRRDLVTKVRVYATAGIEEYWVADLVDEVVVVHRRPTEGAYVDVTRHGTGDVVRACGVDVPLADLFAFVDRGRDA